MTTYNDVDSLAVGWGDGPAMYAAVLKKLEWGNVIMVRHGSAFAGEAACGILGWDGSGGMGGMPLEFRTLIGASYGIGPTVAGSPRRAIEALQTLLANYGVTMIDAWVTGVTRTGSRISSVALSNGDVINLKRYGHVADGTDCGDVLRMAGVEMWVGREAQSKREPLAGFGVMRKQRTKSPYVGGVAANGLMKHILPYPTGREIGSADYGPYSLQGWNFRTPLLKVVDGGVLPTAPPAGYDREDYRWINMQLHPTVYTPQFKKTYAMSGGSEALPKYYDTNVFDIPGVDKVAYVNGTQSVRDAIYAYMKRYWQGYLWYMQNDPDVLPERREGFREFGYTTVEFPDNDGIPYHPYIRTGARFKSLYVCHQDDCQGNWKKDDVIGFGQLSLDQHNHAMYANAPGTRANGYILEGTIGSIAGEASITRPWHIPFRSTIPADGPTNLVAVGLPAGMTAVAQSSARSTGTKQCVAQGVAHGVDIAMRTGRYVGSVGEDAAAAVSQYY